MREDVKKKRIPCVIAALFLSAFTLFPLLEKPIQSIIYAAKAAKAETVGYMQTDIDDDLDDFGINKNSWDYRRDPFGSHELIQFVEFCYSDREDMLQYYGLYFYVYNPTEEEIEGATVEMAVAYDENGVGSEYEKVDLIYCDKTENQRFYKFVVADHTNILLNAQGYEYAYGERRYDIVGLEITYDNGAKIEDEAHSFTYYFSGYGYGLGAGAENASTLMRRKVELDTIELEVNFANYRTNEVQKENKSVWTQLNKAYFSVSEEYFQKYGGLQKIEAEWYEYVTRPIFVTSDSDAYKALYNYLNVDIGEQSDNLKWRVMWDETETKNLPLELSALFSPTFGIITNFAVDKCHIFANLFNQKGGYWEIESQASLIKNIAAYTYPKTANHIAQIDWLLHVDGAKTKDDYKVGTDELQNYMKWYTNRFGGTKVAGKYSATLFEDSIQENRLQFLNDPESKRGYVNQTVDVGDKVKVDQNHVAFSGVEGINKWLFESLLADLPDKTGSEYYVDPFIVITAEDVNALTVNQFATTYQICEEDKNEVYNYCKDVTAKGKRAVLYNFAVTNYTASTARFDYNTNWGDGAAISEHDGYVAQETVFLNFDVISLTFSKDTGEETVIGVVADPIDIVQPLEGPTKFDPEQEALEREVAKAVSIVIVTILIIGGIIAALILLWKFAPAVFYAIVNFFVKIFRGIGNGIKSLFSRIGSAATKKSKEKKKNDKKQNGKEKTESKSPKGNVGKKGGKSKKSGNVSKGTKPKKAGKRKRTSKSKKRKK